MTGYIKLHRKILDSYQFSNPEALKFWIWILLKANHNDAHVSLNIGNGYTDVLVKRGQFIFGRISAAKELKMSESKIYRVLKKLERDKSIEVKSNNKFSIITVCKYDNYNSEKNDSEQLLNNRRTTTEQQANTNKNDKKNKNDNKVNINIYLQYEFFRNDFTQVWADYLEMRKKIKKPATEKAEILALNKVKEFSKNDFSLAKKIVEQSILNSYQGIFELKKNNTNNHDTKRTFQPTNKGFGTI